MSCDKHDNGFNDGYGYGYINVTHRSEVNWLEISIPGVREPGIIIANKTLSYEVSVGEYTVYARSLKTYEPLDGYKWVKTYKIKVQPYLTYNLLVRD